MITVQRRTNDDLDLGDNEFQAVYRLAKDSIVAQDKLCRLYRAARKVLNLGGVWYECGVYKGGSAILLAETIRRSGARIDLHLFDTFTGTPFQGTSDVHLKGDFGDVSFDEVRGKFSEFERVHMHPGIIPSTFIGRENDSIALAYIDVDQEQSVRDCLDFVWRRMLIGGIVVIDDYDWPKCPKVKPLVDSFFHRLPVILEVNPNFEAEVTKRQ